MSTLQKSCNNNRIEGLIQKKNALKRADSYLKSSTILSGDSSDIISNTHYTLWHMHWHLTFFKSNEQS
jgi:hypothetical protein